MWFALLLLVRAEDLVRGEASREASREARGAQGATPRDAPDVDAALASFADAMGGEGDEEQVGEPARRQCRTMDALDMVFADSDASSKRRKYDLRLPVAGDTYEYNMYIAVRELMVADAVCELSLNKAPDDAGYHYAVKCQAAFSLKVQIKPPQSGFLGVLIALVSGEKQLAGTATVDLEGVAYQQETGDQHKAPWEYRKIKEKTLLDLGSEGLFFDTVLKIVQPFLNKNGGFGKQAFQKAEQLLTRFMPKQDTQKLLADAAEAKQKLSDASQRKFDTHAAASVHASVRAHTPELGAPLELALDLSDQVFYPAADLWAVVRELGAGTSADVDPREAARGIDVGLHTNVGSKASHAGDDLDLLHLEQRPSARHRQCVRAQDVVARPVLECQDRGQRIVEVRGCSLATEADRGLQEQVERLRARFGEHAALGQFDLDDQETEALEVELRALEATLAAGMGQDPQRREAYEWQLQSILGGCVGRSRCALSQQAVKKLRRVNRDVAFECAQVHELQAHQATQRGGHSEPIQGSLAPGFKFEQANLWSDNFWGLRSAFGGGYGTWDGPADFEWPVLVTTAGVRRFVLLAEPGASSADEHPVELTVTLTPLESDEPIATHQVEMAEVARFVEIAAAKLPAGHFKLRVELTDPTRDLQDHKRAFTVKGLLVAADQSRPTVFSLPRQLLPMVDQLGLELGEGLDLNLGTTKVDVPTSYIGGIVNKALTGVSRPVRLSPPDVPAWQAKLEGLSSVRPREWPKRLGMDLKELLPRYQAALDLEATVADFDLGTGLAPHMCMSLGLGFSAALDLNGLLQAVANPQGDADYGYPFAAGRVRDDSKGRDRDTLLNCGYLQFFDRGGLDNAEPAEMIPLEQVVATGLATAPDAEPLCVSVVYGEGQKEKRMCGPNAKMTQLHAALQEQQDRFTLAIASGASADSDLQPKGAEVPEKDAEPVQPLRSFFR